MKASPVVRRKCASSVLASAVLAAGAVRAAEEPPAVPEVPPILLSEVLFDAAGVDGSRVGGEWVELYVYQPTNLAGWTLTDPSGALLASLPAATAPAFSSVLIFLSNYVPHGHDGSFADRTAAFAAGLAPGDYLGNLSGGVRLVSPASEIVDCLYWGVGAAPSGASGGPWPDGQFFDIAYGARPTGEGESLGRPANPLDGLTMTVADWDRHGGRNAAGVTAGGRNGVHPADAYGLVRHAQTGVNQIIGGMSTSELPGWIEVVDAHVNDIGVSYSPNTISVSAKHTFELVARGQPATLVGYLMTTCVTNETPGSVSYSLSTSGLLAGSTDDGSVSYELELSQSDVQSGFQTNTLTRTGSTVVTFRQDGVEYPFEIIGTTAISRTGQDTYSMLDQRTASDYGGAGDKLSTALTLATRVSDGTYTTWFGMDRAYPMAPPPLAQAGGQVVTGTEQLFVEAGSVTNDAGEITTGLVWRFDKYRNSTYLVVTMTPGDTGTFSFSSVDGSLGQPSQHMRYLFDAPLIVAGQPRQLSAEVVGTAYIANSKHISEAYGAVRLDGVDILTAAFYVDPPVAQSNGCQHCGSCRRGIIHVHLGCDICDPPPPPPPAPAPAPPPPPAKEPTGFLEASAICAGAGTGIGAATCGTAAGIAGGVVGAGAGGVGAAAGAWAGVKAGAAVGAAVGAGVGWVGCSLGWLFGAFD
jgi:hypothetical protein